MSLSETSTEIVTAAPMLKPVAEMTDRELLEETVTNMRTVGAALAAFQEMGPAKMMASMFASRK